MSEPTQPVPTRPEVSSLRLVLTLALAGTVAGLLLVFVDQLTAPAIAAHKQKMLEQAIGEVLKSPARYETLYWYEGALTSELSDKVDGSKLERIYKGFDTDDRFVGYAIAAAEPGFADTVRLIFGYDAESGTLLGMKVLESKETPGLGDKIEKDEKFVGQFEGRLRPLAGVKSGEGKGEPGEIDMITGATISSKVVIRIINNAIAKWEARIG